MSPRGESTSGRKPQPRELVEGGDALAHEVEAPVAERAHARAHRHGLKLRGQEAVVEVSFDGGTTFTNLLRLNSANVSGISRVNEHKRI